MAHTPAAVQMGREGGGAGRGEEVSLSNAAAQRRAASICCKRPLLLPALLLLLLTSGQVGGQGGREAVAQAAEALVVHNLAVAGAEAADGGQRVACGRVSAGGLFQGMCTREGSSEQKAGQE